MTFPGNFQDHILMDHAHDQRQLHGGFAWTSGAAVARAISPIPGPTGRKRHRGLGWRQTSPYAEALSTLGLPLDGIRRDADIFTALCYITTDMNSNQITGFYPGAMTLPAQYSFPDLDPDTDIAIVSPGNVEDMRRLPAFYKENGVPYIYDPGQQLPVLSGDLSAIEGSSLPASPTTMS